MKTVIVFFAILQNSACRESNAAPFQGCKENVSEAHLVPNSNVTVPSDIYDYCEKRQAVGVLTDLLIRNSKAFEGRKSESRNTPDLLKEIVAAAASSIGLIEKIQSDHIEKWEEDLNEWSNESHSSNQWVTTKFDRDTSFKNPFDDGERVLVLGRLDAVDYQRRNPGERSLQLTKLLANLQFPFLGSRFQAVYELHSNLNYSEVSATAKMRAFTYQHELDLYTSKAWPRIPFELGAEVFFHPRMVRKRKELALLQRINGHELEAVRLWALWSPQSQFVYAEQWIPLDGLRDMARDELKATEIIRERYRKSIAGIRKIIAHENIKYILYPFGFNGYLDDDLGSRYDKIFYEEVIAPLSSIPDVLFIQAGKQIKSAHERLIDNQGIKHSDARTDGSPNRLRVFGHGFDEPKLFDAHTGLSFSKSNLPQVQTFLDANTGDDLAKFLVRPGRTRLELEYAYRVIDFVLGVGKQCVGYSDGSWEPINPGAFLAYERIQAGNLKLPIESGYASNSDTIGLAGAYAVWARRKVSDLPVDSRVKSIIEIMNRGQDQPSLQAPIQAGRLPLLEDSWGLLEEIDRNQAKHAPSYHYFGSPVKEYYKDHFKQYLCNK